MPRVQRGKVSATFEAREAAGCGSLRLLRALRGTRILQAAAPTAPPCFGHWPRSSPLQTKGCSPLIIPKQMGSIQKIQVAALKDFLCCADLKSLRDGRRPTAAYAVCRYDPSCEKADQKNPRLRSNESPSGAFKRQNGLALARWRGHAPTSSADFSDLQIENKIPAEYGQSGAAAILNGQVLPLAQKRQMRYTINTTTAPVFR